eukprot:UN13524
MTSDSKEPPQYFFTRMLTYIQGHEFSEVEEYTPEMLQALGGFAAEFDSRLIGFKHPFMLVESEWNLDFCEDVVTKKIGYIKDLDHKRMVSQYLKEYTKCHAELIKSGQLRKSVCHGDFSCENILVNGDGTDKGHYRIVDFGDMAYSTTVNDLSVLCCYIMQRQDASKPPLTPLQVAAHIAKGYQNVFPLTDEEIKLVIPLAIMRMCVSVVQSSEGQFKDPENEHIT